MPFWEDFGTDLSFEYGHPDYSGNLVGMHLHPHFELLLVANEGKQQLIVNGHTFPDRREPALYLFAPYSMHRVQFAWGEKVERFIYYFTKQSTADENGLDSLQPFLNTTMTRFPLSADLLSKIRPYLQQSKLMKKDNIFQKYNLFALLRLIRKETEPDLILNQGENLTYINQIIQYMVDHCNENLTAEDVCKIFFISRSKLNKIFECHLSVGFHQLLSEMKISQACFMLRQEPIGITEISSKLGFSTDTYFYTFFKKSMGMTPLQWRRKFAPHMIKANRSKEQA